MKELSQTFCLCLHSVMTARGMSLWMARVSGACYRSTSLLSLWLLSLSAFLNAVFSFFIIGFITSSRVDRYSRSYLSACIPALLSPIGPCISRFSSSSFWLSFFYPFLFLVCWDLPSLPTSHLLPSWLPGSLWLQLHTLPRGWFNRLLRIESEKWPPINCPAPTRLSGKLTLPR